MNTMISRFANPGKKEKFIAAAGTSAAALMPFIPMAFAAPTAGSTTAKDLISKVLGIICDIFLGIGVLLLAWSVGMLFLAFKNDDADSKSRAMMMIVSIVLIAFKTILGGVLKSAGTGFTIGEGIF